MDSRPVSSFTATKDEFYHEAAIVHTKKFPSTKVTLFSSHHGFSSTLLPPTCRPWSFPGCPCCSRLRAPWCPVSLRRRLTGHHPLPGSDLWSFMDASLARPLPGSDLWSFMDASHTLALISALHWSERCQAQLEPDCPSVCPSTSVAGWSLRLQQKQTRFMSASDCNTLPPSCCASPEGTAAQTSRILTFPSLRGWKPTDVDPGKTAKALVCEFLFVHSLLWWWIIPPRVPSLLWTPSPLAPSFCSPPLRTLSLLHWSMSASIHTWPDRPVFR